jgi:hypothetical protein
VLGKSSTLTAGHARFESRQVESWFSDQCEEVESASLTKFSKREQPLHPEGRVTE